MNTAPLWLASFILLGGCFACVFLAYLEQDKAGSCRYVAGSVMGVLSIVILVLLSLYPIHS